VNSRVLALNEIDEILAFEASRLDRSSLNPLEKMTSGWSAKWRRESLEHYLNLGWSFAVRDEQGSLQGYFLAQPLLFFRGQTQTLWVEHMAYQNEKAREQLVELAIGWGRDKHLQRVLFAEEGPENRGMLLTDSIIEVKTTKA
jgi:hypothetical protein